MPHDPLDFSAGEMNALNLTGLILGFVGAALAFFDSNRTSSRFTEDGISLGYGPELSTWFWRWCGRMGFACLTVGFLLQFIAALRS